MTETVERRAADFAVSQWVYVDGHYTFAGRDMHGREGKVREVHNYPPDLVEGGGIVEVAMFDGTYTDGSDAFGIAVPFSPADLRPLIVCCRVKCGHRFFYVEARGERATLCLDCANELLGHQS